MTAYLFDLDGTVADTLPFIVQASHLALRELGHDTTDERIISLIGIPLLETGEILVGQGEGETYRECYHKHFQTLDSSSMAAFPGIEDLLAELKTAGGKLACVTSKRRVPTEKSLIQVGLRHYFSVIVSAEDTERHKPHGEPARLALELLEAQGEEAIFIGDSRFDIGCAKNAGLPSCAVTWGADSEQQLREAGANYVAHTAEELRGILLPRQ